MQVRSNALELSISNNYQERLGKQVVVFQVRMQASSPWGKSYLRWVWFDIRSSISQEKSDNHCRISTSRGVDNHPKISSKAPVIKEPLMPLSTQQS